jgi:hypothetical protein
MRTIRVYVTEEDIKNNQSCQGQRCPIHAAIQRLIPSIPVHVTAAQVLRLTGFTNSLSTSRHFGDLPASAQLFISKFDGHKDVEPFEFEMEVDL